MDKVLISNLKKIPTKGGDIYHALKTSDENFHGFGEAYFSNIEFNNIKAWKRHLNMTCNLIVPHGKVRFVFFDDHIGNKEIVDIGVDNYCRITVKPKTWFGFKGLNSPSSLILNISDIPHNPKEIERKEINSIKFDWS
mgnify:CR=1 FL=1